MNKEFKNNIYKVCLNIFNFGKTNIEYLIYFIIYPYILIKYFLFRQTKNPLIKLIKIFIGCSFIIPWLGISIVFLLPLYLYKQLIIIILKYRLGKKYVGLVVGVDGVLTLYGEMGGTVNFTSFIESNLNEDEFLESLHKKVRMLTTSLSTPTKLKCVRNYFMGHLYFEKVNYISSSEIIHHLSLEGQTENGFLDKIDEVIMTELPRNNTFNWSIHWSKSKENTYIVILRIHHTLADAFGLYNIMSNILLKADPIKDKYAESFSNISKEPFKIRTDIKNAYNVLNVPENYLFIPNTYTGGVHGYFVESEPIYLDKIRVIRKAVKGTGVLNVISTGFSAALSDHIKRKGLNGPHVPREILVVTPVQEKMDRMYEFYTNKFCSNLSNDFTYLPFNIPFRNEGFMDIEERFNKINTEIKESYDSCDRKIFYIFLRTYLEVIPNRIAKFIPKVICSGTLGFATGGPRLDFFNGGVVKSIAVFVPALEANALAFCLYSFDNKLAVSLAVNKSKFSQEDVNEILKNTFYNIDLLYERYKI